MGLLHVLAILFLTLLTLVKRIDAKCDLEVPPRPKQQETLKVMKRDWVSHQLVSEVAAILLEDVLMYDIERHKPDTGPLDDIRALSLDQADVNFEVWQGGKEKEIETWVENGHATIAGGHSMLAEDGIYTLRHTIERFPEAEFYQYLQSPQLQWVFSSSYFRKGEAEADTSDLCASPAWNCTDFIWKPPLCRNGTMRCLGQVLHDYPHYSQGVIEQQIANNGLPLSIVYLTRLSKQIAIWNLSIKWYCNFCFSPCRKAIIGAMIGICCGTAHCRQLFDFFKITTWHLRNAFASKKDILFKHHYPSEGVEGVPRSAFVPIQFSPKRYGCNATETSTPEGGFSCRLESKRLLKVASPKFMQSGDASYFAQRFSLGNEDYEQLFDLWRHYDGDAQQAACRWLKDKGSLKWGSWIRFSKQVRFIRQFPPVDGCFPTFYLFMVSALTLAFVHSIMPSCFRVCKRWCHRGRFDENRSCEPTDLSDIQRRMNDRANYTLPDFTSKLVACRSSSFVEVKMALLRGSMGFMSFFRDEEDFCNDPGKAMLPPRASSCFRQYFQTSLQVLVYILTSGLVHIAVSALIFALATGMVGALLAEVRATMEKNKQVDPLLQIEDWYTTWLSKMQTITILMDDFKFLPTFFITYMIGQDVSRWLQWLQIMFKVQGRLHDVALVVASSYRKVNDPSIGQGQRQMLFKWYRYINAIHYMGYFKLAPSIGTSAEGVLQDLRTVGLLKDPESLGKHLIQQIFGSFLLSHVFNYVCMCVCP